MPVAFLNDIRDHDKIAPRRMAERLGVPMARLARMARINRNTMTNRPESAAVQEKLEEIALIIARAVEMSGHEGRAIIWFRHQPITGFGKTAEELVEAGQAKAVLCTLEMMEQGSYA